MDTPTTALSRVEQVLQRSEMGLTIQRITQEARVTEKEAKASIKTLHAMGQIEMIPTPGRWGPRYAWLAATPVAAEPPAVPDADPPAGAVAVAEGEPGPELVDLPMLGGTATEAFMEAASRAAESLPRAFRDMLDAAELEPTLTERLASYYGAHYQQEPTRWAVAVPKRPLRVVTTRARAEALALAAVRRGAKGAEVFALTVVGRARRDAVFVETGA